MDNTATLTVTFGTGAGSAALSAEVDDEATIATSPYAPGSQVVLRLFGRGSATITTQVLCCSANLAAAGQTMTQTDVVTVAKSDRLSLSKPAKSTPQITWLAVIGTPGAISLDPADPSTVQLANEVTLAVAEVSYEVSYDRYTLANLSGQKALVLFEASDGRSCPVELDVLQPSATKQDVVLTVKDYSTDAPIAGAYVSITGPFGYTWNAQSDADGVIRLNGLVSGDYALTATAGGYQSTDQDILANDRFTL